ncbi:MAG TPA: glycerol kinase GlpK [Microlunatus sp.]|nr:glycerol kinase GlpK [Microlunatus sp.]
MADLVAAIDQGTTSTRCILFDRAGTAVSSHQIEHDQIMPRAGWVEHDPLQIWQRTETVVQQSMAAAGVAASDLAAVGLTNQRETTIVWDRRTGQPYHNAIVWQDTRTAQLVGELDRSGQGDLIRERAGIPPATYFAGGKLAWLLRQVDGLRAAAESGDALFGTIDTWLLWNLTGGVDGGQHLTDVTNASRTMLMNLADLRWDPDLLELFDIPPQLLPEIVPSSHPEAFGTTRSAFDGEVVIGGVLGDQHAAMVGQVCLDEGEAKNTYGTGNFLLVNTGTEIVRSSHGLLSTVCYQFGDDPARYALEGSIAVTGSAIQWLRDQLGIVASAAEADRLARTVPDTDGLYFVPAFSGLFAPYWRADARGAIVGMTRFHTAAHLARATLESICYSSYDLVKAMEADSGITMTSLKVDGGVTKSDLTMQLQADVLGLDVIRPVVPETTALGAGYAAGLAVGVWDTAEDFRANWHEDRRWFSQIDADARAAGIAHWHKAVERTLDWVED